MTEQPFEKPIGQYESAEEFFAEVLDKGLAGEAMHIEAFLNELFLVTEAEDRMARAWMKTDMTGPLPPSIQRVASGPVFDDRFYQLVTKYGMRSTPFRAEVLENLYAAALRRAQREGGSLS